MKIIFYNTSEDYNTRSLYQAAKHPGGATDLMGGGNGHDLLLSLFERVEFDKHSEALRSHQKL